MDKNFLVVTLSGNIDGNICFADKRKTARNALFLRLSELFLKQGMRESNSHQRFWRPLSYHLTNPLCKRLTAAYTFVQACLGKCVRIRQTACIFCFQIEVFTPHPAASQPPSPQEEGLSGEEGI